MSVSPLDLQILYSNLKRVGQQQASERSAEVMQQDKQAEELVKKADIKDHQVSETREIDQGTEKIKDKEKKQHEQPKKKNPDKQEEENKETERKFFKDPDIGHHIDISG